MQFPDNTFPLEVLQEALLTHLLNNSRP